MKLEVFKDYFPKIFLFLCFLYGFVPFETSPPILAHIIHVISLSLIAFCSLIQSDFKVRINLQTKISLIILLFTILIGFLVSYQITGLIFAFSIGFGTVMSSIIHDNKKIHNELVIVLRWVLLLSIITLSFQIIFLNFTGEVFKIHEMIYPFSNARISINEDFNYLHRMGGLHIEPGTYANVTYLFLIIYLLITNKTKSILLFVGAFSMVLSNSVWGMAAGIYFIIVLIISNVSKMQWFWKVCVFISLIALSISSYSYVIERAELKYAREKLMSESESVSLKEDFLEKYLDKFDGFLFFGEGFDPQFELGLPAPQDSGFLLNLSIVVGILFTIYLLTIYIISCLKYKDWIILIMSLPVILNKAYYYDAIIWLLFFLVLNHQYKDFNKTKYVVK